MPYAESSDGVHFEKPELDLFAFGDIERTNIVLVGSGGYSYRYANSVVVDVDDPEPGRRYKMVYYDFERDGDEEYPGVCVAFSPDGIHWTKHGQLPVLKTSYGKWGRALPFADGSGNADGEKNPWDVPLSMSDGVDVLWDPVRQVYAIYGKMWMDGPDGRMYWKHGMGRTESRDFVTWSQPQMVCWPDDEDDLHVEFHTTPVFYHEGLYCCLNQILDRATGHGVIDIELMLSRDGVDWRRPFRDQWFLERSPGRQFDSGSIFTNSTPVVLEDEMRFYYGAYSQGATSADDRTHLSGVGMAVLPRDRLAGIGPVERVDLPTQRQVFEGVGQVTLKPMDLAGCTGIAVNADAAGGAVWVEVLDGQGRLVPGYTREDAVPVTGDGLRHEVGWKGKGVGDLLEGGCHLRLHLERAVVYAVYLAGI